MAAPPLTTLMEIVNEVALSVGHPKTSDAVGSKDEAILRLTFYANQACSELVTEHDWNDLTIPHSISIFADSADQVEKAFDLPEDFASFIDDTHWNRSMQLPAIGPVTPQDWQWMVVRRAKVTTRFLWRLRGGKLWIKSPPVAAQPLVFEYLSKYWARDAQSGAAKAKMDNNNDYHIFPWNLAVLLTRAKWLKNEGYDDTAAMADYNKALEFNKGGDVGATRLSLVPGSGYPYVTALRNLPDTGYGET